MLLDSAKERPLGATVTWVACARIAAIFAGRWLVGVDDGVDLLVGIAERDEVDRHPRPVLRRTVKLSSPSPIAGFGDDGPVELGHLPRLPRVVAAG